ncbi:MAG: hypothetical protein JNL95_11245 [Chitinophagales bacterium]|nr:hypothetical protein [Chitinophagales bacterium]
MTTKIKTILLTIFFLFGLLTAIEAHDNYDYAIVKYTDSHSTKSGLFISISGKPFEVVEIPKDQVKDFSCDFTFLLNYIQTMNSNGWNVISSSHEAPFMIFVLERKKN